MECRRHSEAPLVLIGEQQRNSDQCAGVQLRGCAEMGVRPSDLRVDKEGEDQDEEAEAGRERGEPEVEVREGGEQAAGVQGDRPRRGQRDRVVGPAGELGRRGGAGGVRGGAQGGGQE